MKTVNLKVKVIMNTSLEEVLGWKCCSLPGMNLEIQVINQGDGPVRIKSEIEFLGANKSERIDYLYPHGVHSIAPRDRLAFYCSFEEDRFRDFTLVVVRDEYGHGLVAPITGDEEEAKPEQGRGSGQV